MSGSRQYLIIKHKNHEKRDDQLSSTRDKNTDPPLVRSSQQMRKSNQDISEIHDPTYKLQKIRGTEAHVQGHHHEQDSEPWKQGKWSRFSSKEADKKNNRWERDYKLSETWETGPLHGSLPRGGEGACVTRWSYEPCPIGPPKMDRSQGRGQTKRDPLEEGMQNTQYACRETLMNCKKTKKYDTERWVPQVGGIW